MAVADRVPLAEAAAVFVFNGPSSSGKTSLCSALQSRLVQAHQHLQLDAFRAMEPAGYWDDWERQPPNLVARRLAALCRAMNAAVSAYLRHGLPVLLDVALTHPESWRYLLEDLADLPV